MEASKNRLAWLDIAKAITIFLVVFGHTLRGSMSQQIVYSFHVATFFFLSGMTCKGDQPLKRIKNDLVRIMVPYYCFGIISILVFFFLGAFAADKLNFDVNTSFSNNLLELLFACPKGNRMKFNIPLWFLPCLFVVKLLYYALHKVFKGKQTAILFSSFGLAALGFIYVRFIGIRLPFNISVAVKMLAFFSLGRSFYLALPSFEKHRISKLKAFLVGAALLLVTGVVAAFHPKVNYSGDTFPNIPMFLLTATLGSFGIFFICRGIEKCKFLEYIGQKTLSILVMHKFPVLLFQTIGPLKPYLENTDSFVGITISIIVSAIAIALCLIAEKIISKICPFLLGDFSWFRRKSLNNSVQ